MATSSGLRSQLSSTRHPSLGSLGPGTGGLFLNQGEKRDALNPLPLVPAARSRRQELITSISASGGMFFPT
jgi:hypothetical protein